MRNLPWLILCTACDPIEPGAGGVLMLDPVVDVSNATFLRVQADSVLPPSRGARFPKNATYAITDDMWPLNYSVGAQYKGSSEFAEWRVRAWLTDDETQEMPLDGQPYGEALFEVTAWQRVYIGLTPDVDFTIDGLFESPIEGM